MVGLLVLEVALVANHYGLYFIVRIILDFEEPLVEVLEAVALGQVEYQEGSNRTLVVGASDRLEGLLSSLHTKI